MIISPDSIRLIEPWFIRSRAANSVCLSPIRSRIAFSSFLFIMHNTYHDWSRGVNHSRSLIQIVERAMRRILWRRKHWRHSGALRSDQARIAANPRF